MPLKMYTAVTPAAVEPAKMFFTKVTPNNGANNRHACRRRATFKFVMQEDKTATEANGFYQRLHRHSALYRMILARPFAPDLILDTWYRIDLELVSELGLSLKGETAKSCRMILTCELHAQQEGEGLLRQVKDYQIEIRPLQLSAWDNVENAPETPGFHNSGLGGLEVKVLGNRQHLTKTKYFLRIFPTFSSYQTYNAIPLTIGPLEITNQASSTLGWDMDTRCKDLHRIYCLERLVQQQQQQFPSAATFSPLLNKYFLIKEGWNDGTPGKIWDSALVLSDMLAKKIARAPDCLENRHIIDLSAGTGCVGLLLGVVLKYLNPTHHARITLTDLPEALGLLKHNMKTNFNNKPDSRIGVSALTWGNQSDASKVLARGKADIILASDVLYQPKLFPALIKSLVHLSTPGKTVIYLGYKRRGLQEADEKDFFDRAGKHFHIDVLQRDIEEYQHPVEWEKSVGFVEKDHGDLDGIGCLGRNACSRSEEVVFGGYSKESGVTVYRLVPKT